MLASRVLTFRRIDPRRDGDACYEHHREAHLASFGDLAHCREQRHYVRWMRGKIEEFPDGYVLAMLGKRCVGHLELEVPYGLEAGYVNLFHVAGEFRRLGIGRRLHAEYAEPYFRSWEARRIDLHVAPTNRPAVAFYRSLGYRFTGDEPTGARMRVMSKDL